MLGGPPRGAPPEELPSQGHAQAGFQSVRDATTRAGVESWDKQKSAYFHSSCQKSLPPSKANVSYKSGHVSVPLCQITNSPFCLVVGVLLSIPRPGIP